MGNKFIAKTWNNGTTTYGLRVGKRNRDDFFQTQWLQVVLELEGEIHPLTIFIESAFWRKCPELRHNDIRQWLRKHHLDQWPKGKPHPISMEALGNNHFRAYIPNKEQG